MTYRLFEPSPFLFHRMPNDVIRSGAPFSHIYAATDPDESSSGESYRYTVDGAIVIKVDGACPGNGTHYARAGLGVYFGPNSRYNHCERLDGRQTNQRAEILAAYRALQLCQTAREYDGHDWMDHIVLVSDSEYVVKSMTVWIHKWVQNGWRNAQGYDLTNKEELQDLDELIDELDGEGVKVEFWQVPREYNTEADHLAGEGVNM